MRNLLNGFLFSADASGETAAAIDPIVTPYSDRTIPVLTIVFLIVGVLLLLAFAVASFIMIQKRTKNWGYGLLTGLASYLLFSYAVNMLIIFGLNKIPGAEAYFAAHEKLYNLIMMFVAMGLELCAVFLGYRYYKVSAEKRNMQPEPGSAVIFGWAFYLGAILVSQQMTYSLEYTLVCISINQMGFDPAVTAMVEGGTSEEEAIAGLLQMVEQNPFEYLMDTFAYFVKAFLQTSAAVLIYGCFYGKLEKKFMLTAAVTIMVYYIPGLLSVVTNIPTWAAFAAALAIGGAFTYNAYRIIREKMPDELRAFLEIKKSSGSFGGRGKKEPQKMPKIVMPK